MKHIAIVLFLSSLLRRGLRDILALRVGNDGAPRVLRGPPDWRAGRPHHRPARVEEFRAEAARAAVVVDSARRVRRLHYIRHPLQRDEPDARGAGR